MANFSPLADRVVGKRLEREEKTKSGFVIPDTAKDKPQQGEVIALRPGRVNYEGKTFPLELKVGDKVIYSKFAGTEWKEGDVEYLILRESDILAKIS